MFGLMFSLAQFSISIVYPLHQSYKTIQTNDAKEISQWLIYWIVLSLLVNLQNFFHPIIRFIPFIGVFKTYVLIWLVFPILDKNDYKFDKSQTNVNLAEAGDKINGAMIVWDFYIIPLLLNFDTKLTEFIRLNTTNLKKISINLYNLVIDTWFNGNKSLKIFGTFEEPEKDESFMGSVYVIFKESNFLSTSMLLNSNDDGSSQERATSASLHNNKNLTLLKSLFSIIPYQISSSNTLSEQESTTSKAATTSSDVKSTSNNIEEFDVVDASEFPDNDDSDGSVTSTGWFKWRGSTSTAGLLNVETSADQN